MKYLKFSLILMVALTALTGCMSAEPESKSQDKQAQDDIHFIRQRPSDTPRFLALFEGKLVLSKACLRIQSTDDGESYTAIWPSGFSLAVQGNSTQILNGNKTVVAQVGEQIQVSGGEIPQLSPEEFAANFEGSATQCTAPYWVINDDIKVVKP